MADNENRQVWVTPNLEQIEMVDTSVVTGGCSNDTGSKGMMEAENPTMNCSVGS